MPPSSARSRAELTEEVRTSLCASLRAARRSDEPYRHFLVSAVLPAGMPAELRALPFTAPDLDGLSGKRELHNDARHYFDARNCARFAVCAALAGAFQSGEVARAVEQVTGARLAGTFVRLEYAQDTDGFWLEPHTDLGVKRLTMLIYLRASADQDDLGTDIYSDHETWARRTEFIDNTALMFVPGRNTWHGLERRPIAGVRTSIIMNYVTDEWRERSQLAFPATPVLS